MKGLGVQFLSVYINEYEDLTGFVTPDGKCLLVYCREEIDGLKLKEIILRDSDNLRLSLKGIYYCLLCQTPWETSIYKKEKAKLQMLWGSPEIVNNYINTSFESKYGNKNLNDVLSELYTNVLKSIEDYNKSSFKLEVLSDKERWL